MSVIKSYLRDESGATAIEYGLLSALIGLGIIGATRGMGQSLNSSFANTAAEIEVAGT